MKRILNKTKNSSERYTLISGSMGNHGEPETSPNHRFCVANGVNRGNGYQGYTAVNYFFTQDYIAQEIKDELKRVLISYGYKMDEL